MSVSPQLNIMSFICELLEWFEVKRPDFVKPIQAIDLTGRTLVECHEEKLHVAPQIRDVNHSVFTLCLSDISGLLDCTSPVSANGKR